jgi:hypothetical protein
MMMHEASWGWWLNAKEVPHRGGWLKNVCVSKPMSLYAHSRTATKNKGDGVEKVS